MALKKSMKSILRCGHDNDMALKVNSVCNDLQQTSINADKITELSEQLVS